jgi:hypothetical protein
MDLGDVRQERLHRLPDLGVGDASLGLEHDVADLAGSLPAELGIEDVRAALALDAGQSEVVSIVGADGSHHAAQHDDRGEPDDQDGAPPPVARRRESADERVHDGIVRPSAEPGIVAATEDLSGSYLEIGCVTLPGGPDDYRPTGVARERRLDGFESRCRACGTRRRGGSRRFWS